MNKIILIGNLTKDPAAKKTQKGDTLCYFTVAVNGKEKADFFSVSAWGTLGENCSKFLSKGSKVAVVGKLSTSEVFSEKDGVKKTFVNVTASEVEFLTPKNKEQDPDLLF